MLTIKKLMKLKKHIIKKHKKMVFVTLWSIILIVIVLSIPKESVVQNQKAEFFVQTQTFQEFTNWINIKKPGKIIWAEEVVISSQAMWTIQEIQTKEWEDIQNEKTLITLKDNIANYWINLERAKNALNSARLQYQQNKVQLEQWITNSRLALERSQTSLQTTQTLWTQNIKWAENTLSNSTSQKNSLVLQLESEKNKLKTFLQDVLHKNDSILWVTTQYKTQNDEFEIYLSAKSTSYKNQAKSQLLDLYNQQDKLNNLNTSQSISNDELKSNAEFMDLIYEKIEKLLNTMENVLIKSVSSTTFTQTTIDWYISANDLLQSTLQWNFGYFTNFKQSLDSAIITNENWSNIIWDESAKIWYESTLASTQQQISDAKIWLENARVSYESALKTKDSTLWLSATNIKSAELAYQEALRQYEKLNIKSPFAWKVGKILVDKGQEISIWTPLLTLTNNAEPIVEVGITATEYNKINSWTIVTIEYMWSTLSGDIISMSSKAESNGLYNLTIKLKEKIEIIWDTAEISIYSKTTRKTLPLNIVKPLDKNNGYIYVLKDGEPEIMNVVFGNIRWDQIEIQTDIPQDTIIITNNIENYNPNIHELVHKNNIE